MSIFAPDSHRADVSSDRPPIPLPAWRAELADYPATSHFASVGGFQMHYVDEGNVEGSGAPVLMVHGNPTWSFYYRHLVNQLSPTHRAIAVDHIGCGLSEKPRDLPYTLDLRIQHLREFVDQLDLRDITLLVHDWGGAIGLGAALEDLSRYRRFVIFNTGAFPPPYFPWRIRICRAPVLGKFGVQGLNLFARAAIRMATGQRGGLPDDVAHGLLAPYDSWNNRRAIHEFVTDIPVRPAQPTWQRLEQIESGLTQLQDFPVKLLWGMRDWCFRPECLRKFQALLPNAETREFEQAGHYVVEDARDDVIAEVQDFLSR
ncbi:MAG: alpha/beta fold hydrolase [Pirellulaceae bacterium]